MSDDFRGREGKEGIVKKGKDGMRGTDFAPC